MALSEVEETVTTIEIDEETYEEIYKVIILYYYNYSYKRINSLSDPKCGGCTVL